MYFFRQLFLACALAAMVSPAFATNGYLVHGYGIKSRGMAGAGVAAPQDSLAAASNPAGIAFVGNRIDASAALFSPRRSYEISGPPTGPFPLANGKVDSDRDYFVLPEAGATWKFNEKVSFGLALYGHGGMNTDYSASKTTSNGTFGAGTTGVDLVQVFLSPSFAYRFENDAAVGIAPIFAYQRFEARGISSFGGLSNDSTQLSGNGHDHSYGAGLNFGFILPVNNWLTLGGGYHSRIYMTDFDDYKGLFAEQGGFDIPAMVTLGFAFNATEKLKLLLDVEKVWYSQIDSVGNTMMPAMLQCMTRVTATAPACLGGDNGIGFGWDDMTTVKFGIQYEAANDWTWRAGYSHGNQPIPDSEVFFNILAPGVMEHHFTAGFTKKFDSGKQEINFAAMYAPSHKVSGTIPSDQTVELEMKQFQLELGWSLLF